MSKFMYTGCVLGIILFVYCGYCCAAVSPRKGAVLICAEYQGSNARIAPQNDEYNNEEYDTNEENDKISTKPEKVKERRCDKENDVCYAVWHVDINGTQVIEMQGCWTNIAKHTNCNRDHQCTNTRPHSTIHYHRFCCCTENMCNSNLTERDLPVYTNRNVVVIEDHSTSAYNSTILSALKSHRLWLVVFIISIPMIVSLIYVAFCRNRTDTEPKIVAVQLPNPKFSSDLLNVDNLKLCSMIGQGKYGTVWKGMINEQTVAVKIFPTHHKDYFLNEKDIYCLTAMDSPYFLEYFGCDERRTLDDSIEYLLVLSIAPLGCLQEWLTQHTLSFDGFIKMARSIAGGLSYLHTQITQGNAYKPSVVHRDFNSRNILVKDDLTCCISDFGFALKTFGPRYEWKGTMSLAEYKSLNEVGTVRYMAPEMLEGAVNLRDCETALKQIDIYSLGLVLWELFTRCQEFYLPHDNVPPYKQPYEDDVGKLPSLEQMQILVSRQKVRPKFPDAWKRNVSAKIAKDTCEDCWDHDPDARLTAICVEERLREMSTHRLQSPTVAEIPILPITSKSVIAQHSSFNENVHFIASISNGTISNGTTSTSLDIRECRSSDDTMYDIKQTSNQLRFPKLKLTTGSGGGSGGGGGGGGWSKIRTLFNEKINLTSKRNDEMSILTDDNRSIGKLGESQPPTSIYQQSNLIDNNRVHIKTKHLPQIRPKNLDLALPHINTPDSTLLSPTVDNAQQCASHSRNYQSMYKRPPGDFSSQQFTIVDESDAKMNMNMNRLRKPTGLVVSKSANAMKSLQNIDFTDENQVKRQRSLEVFRDVFGVKGSIERLRDPSERIKTPGDVPKSVRRVRASKTLSLYDDRMMNINASSSGSTL